MWVFAYLQTTANVFATEDWMLVAPTCGMLIVAVQVYWPPSEILREEKVWFNILVATTDISVVLGKTIFMWGSATSPATTLAEHLKV